jgi:hypothetical protein
MAGDRLGELFVMGELFGVAVLTIIQDIPSLNRFSMRSPLFLGEAGRYGRPFCGIEWDDGRILR